MQLISTKGYYESSTEYQKRPFAITQIESYFTPANLIYPLKEMGEELSFSLKTIKDIESLERIYTFKHPNDIKRLLLSFEFLIPALFEAYKQILEIFKENALELSLEYDRDPEEDFEGLSIIIRTNLSPESSLDLLNKFDQEWWLDIDYEIRKILNVMIRPI